MSCDTVASHKDFCQDSALPFRLVADVERTWARAFGVPVDDGTPERTTFVVDPEGVVRRVFPKVKVWGHATEVLQALAALQRPTPR